MKQKVDAATIREARQIRVDFEALKKRMGKRATAHPGIQDIEKRLRKLELKLG
jgi:hypothetical protein